ncbi:uncharacterized protein LOC127845280 [Dreissena polymorpha]|uniref:uncharacterized protein LOC127845280 n=1 Tax=Dreissena polymorpha TaxID=45954 RepID=UPI002264CE73|nr:uncharacterized protein LOC127845280 [Dreissena polymorpha]
MAHDMTGVSKFGFAALRPISKAMYTGFLLAFIIGVLEADFIRNPSSTWYDGYIKCLQNGQTMLTWGDVQFRRTSHLKITYPIWLNGFEVLLNGLDQNFKLHKYRNTRTRVRCMNSSEFANKFLGFEEGSKYCQNQTNGLHKDLPFVNHTNLYMFRMFTSDMYWIQDIDVAPFLNSEDLTVHCYVLNAFDDLQKDNCTNKYSSICINETVHDTIKYSTYKTKMRNYDPTSSGTTEKSAAVTSVFVTSLVTFVTYIDVDLTTSATNTPFYLTDTTSDPKTEEDVKTSSLIIWLATALGLCLLLLVVIVACLCLKRNQENNNRTTFQQNELVQPSIVPQGHGDNIVNYDVILDDVTGREATPYTSLQMTEKHLYTALTVRLENNDEEPDNDSPLETNYADVEVPDNEGQGQTNTHSEAKVYYFVVK